MCIYVCMCIYMYVYMCIYTHTYIHVAVLSLDQTARHLQVLDTSLKYLL